MIRRDFRFAPPEVKGSAALRWVLARAFAPPGTPMEEPEGAEAAALAQRLGLAPRLAARHAFPVLAGEIGAPAAEEFRRAQRQAVASDLLLEAALVAFDAVAAELRVPYAPLKGRALVLGGYCRAAARVSSDVDVLVPEERLEALQEELERRGFERRGKAYEHQAPALAHRDGGVLELHRVILGVRFGRRRSATYADLSSAGRLAPLSASASDPGWRPRGDLRLPSREVLASHALVHALAQHGFSPDAYPGFQLIGDLLDLGIGRLPGDANLATLLPWIEPAVGAAEARAALDLAAALVARSSGKEAALSEDARSLHDHFFRGAFDPQYVQSLKARALENPLSDRGPAAARAAAVVGALLPERQRSEGLGAYLGRLALRPFDLVRRWRRARDAARDLG